MEYWKPDNTVYLIVKGKRSISCLHLLQKESCFSLVSYESVMYAVSRQVSRGLLYLWITSEFTSVVIKFIPAC